MAIMKLQVGKRGWSPQFLRMRRQRAGMNPSRLPVTMQLCVVAFGLLALMVSACHRSADQSLTRAAEAWDSGDYKSSAEEYERYLYQSPTGEKSPEARFQLANIYYFKLKRYDQARSHYTTF